jgi:hypothetical protein
VRAQFPGASSASSAGLCALCPCRPHSPQIVPPEVISEQYKASVCKLDGPIVSLPIKAGPFAMCGRCVDGRAPLCLLVLPRTMALMFLGFKSLAVFWAGTQCGSYIRIAAPAAGGNYGCELWLSRRASVVQSNDGTLRFSMDAVSVLHSEARHLVAYVVVGPLRVVFSVAHAPNNGSASTTQVDEWWASVTRTILGCMRDGAVLVCLHDTNQQLAASAGDCCGAIGWQSTTNA